MISKNGNLTFTVISTTLLIPVLITGCGTKASEESDHTDIVTGYVDSCVAMDFEAAAQYVQYSDNAFDSYTIDTVQSELLQIALDKSEYSIVSSDTDTVTVEFKMPDIDESLKGQDIMSLEVEDIAGLIDGNEMWSSQEFTFDITGDETIGEYMITPESTEAFAEYIMSAGGESIHLLELRESILPQFDMFVSYMAQGDFDGALRMTDFDQQYPYGYSLNGVDLIGMADPICESSFGRFDYEAELTSLSASSATIHITGMRPDIQTSIDYICQNDADATIPMIKERITQNVGIYRDSGDYVKLTADWLQALADFVLYCSGEADLEEFEAYVHVDISSDGAIIMDSYDAFALTGLTEFVDKLELDDDFYYQALDEMLEDGLIDQDTHDEYYGYSPDYFVPGIT